MLSSEGRTWILLKRSRCKLGSAAKENKIRNKAKDQRTRAGDRSLGMDTGITRRDFLGSALLASGSVLLAGATPAELLGEDDDFTGYGGVGEYSRSNGNTWDVLSAGHAIRDSLYDPLPKEVI